MEQDETKPDIKKHFLGEYLAFHGKTQEEAGAAISMQKAGMNKIINGSRALKTDYAKKLWVWLGYPESTWQNLYDAPPNEAASLVPTATRPIEVKGFVQGGIWRNVIELPEADRYQIMAPAKGPYAHLSPYGLEVRGESMNRLFPDGTVVEVVNFSDIGRPPETGECIVAVRRDCSGMEATLKLFQQAEDGTVFLWPRSTDPEWQQPLRLCHAQDGDRHYLDFGDRSDGMDTEALALVIGAHLPVGKFPIG